MIKHPVWQWGLVVSVLMGCAPLRTDYGNYLEHFPRSVLVLPPINESLEVDASGMFLSTITTFLAERGYYVLPVAVVDAVFKAEGVPLPPEMHQVSLAKLREVFGADAVLYTTIKKWTTTYVVLDCRTTVVLDYRLVDTATGLHLWCRQRSFQYSPSGQQTNPVAKLVAAAVHAAQSSSGRIERNVAIAANQAVLYDPRHGLLTGPRHPKYEERLQIAKAEQEKFENKRCQTSSE
jgi:hypothetical protein